ncbi:unnamed protein product, partial [Brassica oleracea var. botrytis]
IKLKYANDNLESRNWFSLKKKSSSRSLKSKNPSSGLAPPVPEALLLSPFPCFLFSFFFLVSTFADMFVSLRSMGASRFVYQRGKLWRSLEKRRGNGKTEKKEVGF